jgi:hypothetical protein
MARPIFALADCNNFYVMCERVFRPSLEGRAGRSGWKRRGLPRHST